MTRYAPLYLLVWIAACGSKTDKASDMELVSECVQYQTAFDSCFHRDSGFASQSAMLPKTQVDRQRIQQLCSENLERLKTACR